MAYKRSRELGAHQREASQGNEPNDRRQNKSIKGHSRSQNLPETPKLGAVLSQKITRRSEIAAEEEAYENNSRSE